MSDQCQQCTWKGMLAECRLTDCGIHETWYAKQLEAEVRRLQFCPTLAKCEKGHRFHTTATHPAKNEREWICPWCQIEENKELRKKLEEARKWEGVADNLAVAAKRASKCISWNDADGPVPGIIRNALATYDAAKKP